MIEKRQPGRKRNFEPVAFCIQRFEELSAEGKPDAEIVKTVTEESGRCRQEVNNYFGTWKFLKENER